MGARMPRLLLERCGADDVPGPEPASLSLGDIHNPAVRRDADAIAAARDRICRLYGPMTDYEWRAAELMLKLAIATEALQQKHEENLELIQERNKWQAIAENALEAASPPNPLRERPMLTAKEIEEWYEDEVNAQIVNARSNCLQPTRTPNRVPGSLSPDAGPLSFAGRIRSERRVL